MPETDRAAVARAARQQQAAARQQDLAKRVDQIIGNPLVNDELKRKLQYCQAQITKGRDEGLKSRRAELVREAEKRTNGSQ